MPVSELCRSFLLSSKAENMDNVRIFRHSAEAVRQYRTSCMSKLTHIDASGNALMVDVGGKQISHRIARAGAAVSMKPETLAMIAEGGHKKGDVLAVARI